MEVVSWIVFISWWVLGGFVLFYMDRKTFKRFRVRKPKVEVEPEEPFADFKRYAAEHRRFRDEAHAEWEKEAKALLQKNCEHIYHHQNWYTCYKCGLEEPWEYKDDCTCYHETTHTISSARPTYSVIRRSANCVRHGRDYTYFPLSERKAGPYGYQNDRSSTWGYQRVAEIQRELQRKLGKGNINFDAFTVSSK